MSEMHDEVPILSQLMRWYYSHCDGEWEHSCGVRIDTLDNPGWLVKISLEGTMIDPKSIQDCRVYRDEDDWFEYEAVHDPRMGGLGRQHMGWCFQAFGGPHNLAEIIEHFLRCAK